MYCLNFIFKCKEEEILSFLIFETRGHGPLVHEGVSKSLRTGRLEQNCKCYSPLPLDAVVSLFCGLV